MPIDIYTEEGYWAVLWYAYVLMVVLTVGGQFVKAPYGKFGGGGSYGPEVDPRVGWWLMELPATLSFMWFYYAGGRSGEVVPIVFQCVWLLHYGNRGFLFPGLMRVEKGAKTTFSMSIVLTGWLVTALHGYLNAFFISEVGTHLNSQWLAHPCFVIGLLTYLTGFTLNVYHDAIIRNLRTPSEVAQGVKVYRIPTGGLFHYATSPSYLAEIISFTGMALAQWNPGALFVLGVTIGNLVPRAADSHKWYHEKFGARYPKSRKILIPFVW